MCFDMTLRIQICPKERDYLYIPILVMGLRPSILFDWEGSGFLGFGVVVFFLGGGCPYIAR